MLPEEPGPFPYGVASFEPSATGAILWTRCAEASPLRWEVASDPGFADVVAHGSTETVPSDGSEETNHQAVVEDLAPATEHYYRFLGDHDSPIGRLRTLPDDDRPIRLAFVCCGDFSAGHFGVYRAVAESDVDLVVHLGDYVYADPEGDDRAVEFDHDAVTRSDYRGRYQEVRADPDLQALHQRHAMVSVIDDHDLTDNAHEAGAKNHDEEAHGPWPQRRDAAAAERRDWMPIHEDGPEGRSERGEWRAVQLGELGELVLLDTRLSGRTPPPDADDVDAPDLHGLGRTMLGVAQRDWAIDRLTDTRRPWCLVVSSVVFNPLHLDLPSKIELKASLPEGYLVADGVGVNTDAWDGYPDEQAMLTDAAAQRGRGAVFVSGDVHSSWAWEGPAGNDGEPVAVEFTCPAVTSVPMGEVIPVVSGLLNAMIDGKDGVRWAELFGHGHLLVDVAADSVTGTWVFTDPEDPEASTEVVARWRAALDCPGHLEPVDEDEPGAALGTGVDASTSDQGPRPAVPARPAAVLAAAERRRARRRMLATALATGVILWIEGRWRRG